MVVWYQARKIKNKHMQFLKLNSYFDILTDVKNDKTIPKYSTNLVYLSKADLKSDIESKIMYSIIYKQPKRSDYYWILHVDHVDDPNTFEYTFEPIIENTLFRINLRLGFRIQPLINLYFRQIVEELVENKEFDIISNYPSLQKNKIAGDFRFIIIHRVHNRDHEFKFNEKITMNLYNLIKTFGINDINAFGLDTSNVIIETVPLVVKSEYKHKIKRMEL